MRRQFKDDGKRKIIFAFSSKTGKNYSLLRSVLLVIKNQVYQLVIKNPENISDLKQLLTHYSAVIYLNHLTLIDPLFIMGNLLEDKSFAFQIAAPVSQKHYMIWFLSQTSKCGYL